jgi:DNA-directed RNA polymerase subunit beta'
VFSRPRYVSKSEECGILPPRVGRKHEMPENETTATAEEEIEDLEDLDDVEDIDEDALAEDLDEDLTVIEDDGFDDEDDLTADEEEIEDEVEVEDDDDDHDDETAEALEELENQELQLLDDEANEAMLVDEAAELRAMRREELTLNVDAQSQKDDEFVCQSCFMVKRTSQLANKRKMICFDCVD